jgi:maltose alpha-D-glucosyltransferase/alpha-amylase
VVWQEATLTWLLAMVDLDTAAAGERMSYFLPLALAWEERDEERVRNLATAAVAKIRQQADVGVMGDAFADASFCRAVVQAMATRREVPSAQGKFVFRATAAFADLAGRDYATLNVDSPRGSSSNTVVSMGERLMLKGYRRLRVGLNPELEMGLYLTDVVHFPNCARLAGMVEYVGNDGQVRLLGMLQAFIANQGDGWTYALEYLKRHLEQYRTTPANDALPVNAHEAFLGMMRVLATRTAELHRALAQPSRDPAFAPQPLDLLAANLDAVAGGDRERAAAVLERRAGILARIESMASESETGLKIRIHGDYHLGQVLVTKNDFVIIDFEGEPGNSLEMRRAKHSPLRDVAGMLRSFAYVQQSALRSVAHNEAEAARLAPLARAWELEVRNAFLSAYAAAAQGSPALYTALKPGEGLLGLFELEKALYELRYEVGNRPTWAGIPLQGILDWDAGQ